VEFIFYCACRNDDKSNIALEKILVITLEVLEGSLEAKDCRVVFCPESSVNYNSQLLEILKDVLVAEFEAKPGVSFPVGPNCRRFLWLKIFSFPALERMQLLPVEIVIKSYVLCVT
jgi:hypothetical protein